MTHFAVLIPAYQPDERLTALVETLRQRKIETVVVDDGSTAGVGVLLALEGRDYVTVLRHERNRGKGRALKTGIAYLAAQGFRTVVTADADGQYDAEDIARLADEAQAHPAALLLGVRGAERLPRRHRAGNALLRFLFYALYGVRLRDIQTGLRAMSLEPSSAAALTALRGERYEYEVAMLTDSARLFPGGVREVELAAGTPARSGSSHFRPVRDGVRIYAALLRSLPAAAIASFLVFAVDYALFLLFYYRVLHRALASTVAARLCSGSFSYLLNRVWVAAGKRGRFTFWGYFLLAVCILAAGSALMYLLVDRLGLLPAPTKLAVELVLYALSAAVQRKWFRGRRQT